MGVCLESHGARTREGSNLQDSPQVSGPQPQGSGLQLGLWEGLPKVGRGGVWAILGGGQPGLCGQDWEALEMGLEMSTASFLCSHTSLGFLVSLGLSVSQAPEPRAGPWEGPLSAPA